jgi:hypothetical protein
MRLNFSGVSEEAIREGVRRIGEVVREQVALYSTLTGTGSGAGSEGQLLASGGARPDSQGGAPIDELPADADLAKVLPLLRKHA